MNICPAPFKPKELNGVIKTLWIILFGSSPVLNNVQKKIWKRKTGKLSWMAVYWILFMYSSHSWSLKKSQYNLTLAPVSFPSYRAQLYCEIWSRASTHQYFQVPLLMILFSRNLWNLRRTNAGDLNPNFTLKRSLQQPTSVPGADILFLRVDQAIVVNSLFVTGDFEVCLVDHCELEVKILHLRLSLSSEIS